MAVQLINNLWQFLLVLVLLEDDHKTGWCSEIQYGMNLHLNDYFCTHNSISNCTSSSLSKNALQVCDEGELDGHLKGLFLIGMYCSYL